MDATPVESPTPGGLRAAADAVKGALPSVGQVAVAVLFMSLYCALMWSLGWFVAEVVPPHQYGSDVLRVGWALVVVGLYVFSLAVMSAALWEHVTIGSEQPSRLMRLAVGGQAVATLMVIGFAAFVLVTTLLVQYHRVRLATGGPHSEPLEYVGVSGLYLWHLLDVIPFAKIPDTLGWDEPGPDRDDRAVGLLLIAYKLALLWIVLAAIRGMLTQKPADAPVTVVGALDAELTRLQGLRDDRVVNDDEFDALRGRLLRDATSAAEQPAAPRA